MAKPKKETARQRQMRLRKMKNDMASSNRRLPATGQSGGSKPPKGTSAPQDRRPRPDRRTAAQQKLKQAQQGTRSSGVRQHGGGMAKGVKENLSGYKSDLQSLKNLPKKLKAALKGLPKSKIAAFLARRGPAGLAAGGALYIGNKIRQSAGKEGASNMSLLGGDAPTYGKGKKTKGRTL